MACVEGHMEAADAMEAICATNDVGFRMKDGTTVVHVMDPKIEVASPPCHTWFACTKQHN